MRSTILLLTLAFTCMLYSNAIAQQCTSNYISSFTPTDTASSKASTLVCPTGFVNGMSFLGNRTCLSIPDTILPNYKGLPCAGSSTVCAANWLGCSARTQTCEFRRTRILGDYCTHRENCLGSFGTASAYTNCYNNQCVSFKIQKIVAQVDGACVDNSAAFNETTNILNDCAPGFQCYLGKCQKQTFDSDEGGACGTVSNSVYVNCKQNSGLTCINYVCYTATFLQLGQNCSNLPVSTLCADGLVCRKENINAPAKTCQLPSLYNEHCDTASDCYKLPFIQLRCANNKCIRRFSRLDGEDCENSLDCFNNLCENKKCTSRQLTCTTQSACPSGTDFKCGCGGLSSNSPFNGTCVQPCNGYREDFYACIYNNGVDEITSGLQVSAQFQPVDGNSTVITKLCAKQYANMIKCFKQSWISSGLYDTSYLTSLSGIDVSGPLEMPANLTLPILGRNLTSPSPKVAVSVSMIAHVSEGISLTPNCLTIVISMLFICLSFLL